MTPIRQNPAIPQALPATSERSRRREVERVLADHGLIEGPRRVVERSQPEREDKVQSLRDALEALGSSFTAFGLYLSTRADLFRAPECLILGTLPDRAPAEPQASLRERLEQQLGKPVDTIFDAFVYEPLESGLLEQTHRATLRGGQEVLVVIVRGDDPAGWERDLALLPLLSDALGPEDPGLDEAISDFKRWMSARVDCHRRAESLEVLAREAQGADLLAVPRVFAEGTSARVLTVERLSGVRLGDLADEPGNSGVDARRRRAARRLSHVWLQTALASRTLPVEFDAIELSGDGRIGIIGGSFSALPMASRQNLWNYLRAAAAHYPERAATYLVKELTATGPLTTERELQLRLRQAMPFRDGGWTASADTIAEHMLLHWRIARDCGFGIPAHLKDFYRGVFMVARIGRKLDPAGDPMAEGLEGLNWLAGWTDLRHLTTPRKLGQSLSGAAVTLLGLPQKLERVLRTASLGGEGSGDAARGRAATRRRAWNSATAVATLFVLMTALTILSTRVPLPGSVWVEGGVAALFLVFGAALLWAAWRTR